MGLPKRCADFTALHARSPPCQPRCCLRDCDQVQDWLYTRDAAKATAAQALALASSKQMRAQPLPLSQPSAALFRGAASSSAVESVPLDAHTAAAASAMRCPICIEKSCRDGLAFRAATALCSCLQRTRPLFLPTDIIRHRRNHHIHGSRRHVWHNGHSAAFKAQWRARSRSVSGLSQAAHGCSACAAAFFC